MEKSAHSDLRSQDSEQYLQAQAENRRYHEDLYDQHSLYKSGSWLSNPASFIMKSLDLLDCLNPRILDLGAGVGRHSIAIARKLQHLNPSLACVDVLPLAIELLRRNSIKHQVEQFIEAVVGEQQAFDYGENSFDLIVSCSSIEHCRSLKEFRLLLDKLQRATALQGANCFMINCNVQCIAIDSGEKLPAFVEFELDADFLQEQLKLIYADWNVIELSVKQWSVPEQRGDSQFWYQSQCLQFCAQKLR